MGYFRRIVICITMVTAFMSTVVSGAAFPLTYSDQAGNTVTFRTPPQRIVSMAPSHTEILFALGLGDRVIGIDSYSDYPSAAQKKPVVGDLYTVSLERLVALKPDLVLLYELSAKDLQIRLAALGIPSLILAPESLQGVYDTIRDVGRITGVESTAANVVASMKKKVENVKATAAKAKSRPGVFYEVWSDPLFTAGPGSFVHELITIAGGRNIAEDASSKWPVLSLEVLVTRNPDIILTPLTEQESITSGKKSAQISSIKAIKSGRVQHVDQNIVNRPGPRLADALLIVAKAIHPELF